MDFVSSSNSDSSSEEEIDFLICMNQNVNLRRPYLLRTRIDHLNKWDDLDFIARFRLSKRTFKFVLEMVQQEIATISQRQIKNI